MMDDKQLDIIYKFANVHGSLGHVNDILHDVANNLHFKETLGLEDIILEVMRKIHVVISQVSNILEDFKK